MTTPESFLIASQRTFMFRCCLNALRLLQKQTTIARVTEQTFLTVLEAEKFSIKVAEDSVSGEGLLPDSYTEPFSLCPHMVGGARKLSGFYFTRVLIPLMRALSSWPIHLLKAQPPNPIALGIRFQRMNVGGGRGGAGETQTFSL